ncbi:MAG: DNA-processing protein DprA [Cyanobacteria bacterium P01_F01_bin.42]
MSSERAYCLAWSQITGVGPVIVRRLLQSFGSLSVAWGADAGELKAISGVGDRLLSAISRAQKSVRPADLLAQHSQKNPQFWTYVDADYPRLLKEITDPPLVLYYRGNPTDAELSGLQPAIGIVGTRDPSDYGKRWTHRIATSLARNGFTVVSGMAEGIDTQAHRSCLSTQKRTFGVLGTGVDVVYPLRNRGLYEQICQHGCVVSEYPAGTQPSRAHFPRRNRIIAGLCRSIIVMEAPQKSGALITAYLANDYGRDVYVLPGSLDNPRAMGCLGLLCRGAQVILNEGHLLDMLGKIPQLDETNPPATLAQLAIPLDISEPETKLLKLIQNLCQKQGESSLSFDLLVQNSDQPTGTLSSLLLQLELAGHVVQLPGMRYALAKS